MRTHIRHLAAATLLIVLLAGALLPAPAATQGAVVGPRAMLNAYYALINARNYWPAYQQWVNPPQTYADFVAGYADTSVVTAYFGGYQAGWPYGTEGRVPGVLIGYRTNGSVAAFSGCYQVRYNPAASGIAQWTITGASFRALPAVPAPDAIPAALNIWCYDRYAIDGTYSSVQQMLVDYFAAVNRGDYAHAYSLWARPSQTYAQFVAGWGDTSETVMFYGGYQFSGVYTAAEIGRIPVVLLGYHTDGSLAAFQGCIGVAYNAAAAARWAITRSYVQRMALATTPDAYSIALALNAACY